ncbi:MAG TPA: hypothetical protein VL197_14940 [Nitrospirota bacterium]|nr:hypothetical protein [Nitrospirota bacterium]
MKSYQKIISLFFFASIFLSACSGGGGLTIPLSDAKAITAFSFTNLAATGTIDESAKTISVTVPNGTNVTRLVATFTTTGAGVKVGSTMQISGATENDFTNPVTYLVTAADGSSLAYTVTVTILPADAKAITAFSFTNPAATGTINESTKTIAVIVPFGTDVTALIATFSTNGASVKVVATVQISGATPNDFTSPVTYTVTAADGTVATYTVTVTVTASSAKAIIAFFFTNPAATGTIDENLKTISVIVPMGTDVTGLVAVFTTTGAGVKVGSTVQVSDVTVNDFTSPVTYLVTAADGSSLAYTVRVVIPLSDAKAITAFSFTNPAAPGTIDENAKTISVIVPKGTNVTGLVAAFTTTGAGVKVGSTVQVSGVTANDFTSPVTYLVTAADGSSLAYTATVAIRATTSTIGAIRWDAWMGDSDWAGVQVDKDLGPNHWHYRLPFYAIEISADQVSIIANTQAVIDQEIAYARNAGINYFAYVLYHNSDRLLAGEETALNLYFSSAHKNDINFCFILDGVALSAMTATNIDWIGAKFQDPGYQKVLTNRPLVYVFGDTGAPPDLTPLVTGAQAAGLGAPYFVDMQGNMTSPPPDAYSNYSINGGSSTGAPFTDLMSLARGTWMGHDKGVPLVSAGWDGRPRIENPVSWAQTNWYTNWYLEATPQQIATELSTAVTDVKNNPAQFEANTILIYAWNEFDEGGWICPGLATGLGATPTYEGAVRLNAIAQVLLP